MTSLAPRSDFPLLADSPALHYLDSAATAQKPQVVLDALQHFYTHDNANPHRGAYELSARATERYHEARATIARFIGASHADHTLFVRGTTEAMNLVAYGWGDANLNAGDAIVDGAEDLYNGAKDAIVDFGEDVVDAGKDFYNWLTD